MSEFTLEREVSANYQNGNTLRASTINQRRWKQLYLSNDLEILKEYAKELVQQEIKPLRIINRDLEVVWKS